MANASMPDPQATTSGPGRLGEERELATDVAIADLAAWLHSPHRDVVVAVTTPASRHRRPFIDAASLAVAHASVCEVYVVPDGTPTRLLQSLLPQGGAVFGGATRVYPADTAWIEHPSRAPVIACKDEAGAATARARVDQEIARIVAAQQPRTSGPSGTGTAGSGPGGGRPGFGWPTPTESAQRFVPPVDGTVGVVDTPDQGRSLATYLLDPSRARPVVVVTVHPDADGPYLDAEALAGELSAIAVVLLVSAEATFGLTDGMGDRQLSAFYGAARTYPVGLDWVADMYAAPLRMCSANAGRRVAAKVVDDALAAAYQAGLLDTVTLPDDRPVTGRVVRAMNDHHVLVRTDLGQAIMLAPRLAVGIPADRLVRPRQTLAGRLRGDGAIGTFIPDPEADPAARVAAAYPVGSTVLARVDEVRPDAARLLLHPAVAATLAADDDAPDLTRLLSPGDAVAVVVDRAAPEFVVTLADDLDELLPGVAVVPDGPAWLRPEDLDPERDAEPAPSGTASSQVTPGSPTVSRPAPGSGGQPADPRRVGGPTPPEARPLGTPPPGTSAPGRPATPAGPPRPSPAAMPTRLGGPPPATAGAHTPGTSGTAGGPQPTAAAKPPAPAAPTRPRISPADLAAGRPLGRPAAAAPPPDGPTQRGPGQIGPGHDDPAGRPLPAGFPASQRPVAPAQRSGPPTGLPPIGWSAQKKQLTTQIESLNTTIATLRDEVERRIVVERQLQRELDEFEERTRAAEAEAKRAKSDLRAKNSQLKQARGATSPSPVFADPEAQFRHDVYLAWLHRIREPDRERLALRDDWALGPDFLDSLDRLQGIDRSKVLDVVVEVLTGLAKDLDSRTLKPLLDKPAGRQLVRADGAKAWRVRLQHNSPAARRLHYWARADGTLELDSVGVHDDGLD